MIETHTIQDITFEEDMLTLLIDGRKVSVILEEVSPRLKAANNMERSIYTVSPSGYGIHWPLIDEDLSIEAILKKLGKQ
ncbi:MAG: DUF2442 domain-containing protein [Bacteroidia bacterium]